MYNFIVDVFIVGVCNYVIPRLRIFLLNSQLTYPNTGIRIGTNLCQDLNQMREILILFQLCQDLNKKCNSRSNPLRIQSDFKGKPMDSR